MPQHPDRQTPTLHITDYLRVPGSLVLQPIALNRATYMMLIYRDYLSGKTQAIEDGIADAAIQGLRLTAQEGIDSQRKTFRSAYRQFERIGRFAPALPGKIDELASVFALLIQEEDTPDNRLRNFLDQHPEVEAFIGGRPDWLPKESSS